MIRIEGLRKSFGPLLVLDDISCEIESGKTTAFIGPSGVGKSVLLKHIVALLKPDRGKIWVDGREVTGASERELYEIRKFFGMAFQDGALFDSMTVGENVAFPLVQHTRLGEAQRRAIVREKLAVVGLPGVEEKMPGELSGGMRKRASLARAIALEPRIVLFDEPTSGLDPVLADSIDNLICSMQQELGLTFVVVSHDLACVFKVSHQMGMLYQGHLIEYGPTEEIRRSENPILQQFFSRSSEGPIVAVR